MRSQLLRARNICHCGNKFNARFWRLNNYIYNVFKHAMILHVHNCYKNAWYSLWLNLSWLICIVDKNNYKIKPSMLSPSLSTTWIFIRQSSSQMKKLSRNDLEILKCALGTFKQQASGENERIEEILLFSIHFQAILWFPPYYLQLFCDKTSLEYSSFVCLFLSGLGELKIHGNSVDGPRTERGQINVTGSLTNSRKLSKRKQVLFHFVILQHKRYVWWC